MLEEGVAMPLLYISTSICVLARLLKIEFRDREVSCDRKVWTGDQKLCHISRLLYKVARELYDIVYTLV